MASGWLYVVDFDGTITEEDMLDVVSSRYAPGAYAEAEHGLVEGTMTLHDAIRLEFEGIRGDHDAIVADAVGLARVRPGFERFVREAEARGHEVVVVSSGFEPIIRPVLAGVGAGHVQLVCHDIRFGPQGTRVEFRYGDRCDRCGERCKRSVVAALRNGRRVAYVGDGYSDRCAALDADRRFARASLARHLADAGVPFTPFDDFDALTATLPDGRC